MNDELILEINTVDELDDYLHKKTIETMEAKEKGLEISHKPVKVIYGKEILDLGMENVTKILMMRSIDRALNDPYIKNHPKDEVHESATFENTILPILIGDQKVTYH